jgi:hypothetical protein
MKTIKVKSYADIPKNYTGIVVWPNGEKQWRLNRELHREDGPAIVCPNGAKDWFLNGRLHREEGPCTECKDCQSGNFEPASGSPEVSPKEKSLAKPKTCSKPGPAIVYADGEKRWFLNNKRHREDGPAIVRPNGEKCWFLNGECHREDGPAIIYPDGEKQWRLNGKRHREDGPAIVCAGGEKQWWLNGKEVDKQTVELFYMLKYKKLWKD